MLLLLCNWFQHRVHCINMITQCSSSTRLILLLSSPPCSPLPAHVRTNPNQISPHKSPSNETHITTTPTANTHLTLKRGPYRTSPFSLLPIATVSTAAASTMAHHTNHRRNLPAQEPNASPSMEPTRKKQPKSTLFKPHPKDSDPTIHTLSKRFSKLYSNHRNVVVSSKSSNVSSKPPRIDTHFQAKPMSISAIEDKSISKSTHQSRKTMLEVEKEKLGASITGVFDKSLSKAHEGHDFKIEFLSGKIDEGKKSSKKGKGNKEFHEDRDVKKSFDSLSKSQDSGLKVVREGDEMKRPSFSLSVTGGRRRSFCNSQAELADFLSCNGVKVVSVDMPPFMQIHAVDCARKTCDSLEKFTSKTLAFTLKKEFDGVYGPAWHCIVGSSFGSFVTHSVGGFLYFSMDHKHYILLFKTTVQRAD